MGFTLVKGSERRGLVGESEYITVPQAAEHLGVTRARVHQFIREGRLKVIRPGREYVIGRAEFERFAAIPRPSGIQRGAR